MNFLNKRGEILVGNIVFIVLNLIFLGILILFIFLQTGNPAILEEKYAKEIALMIDSAKPGMIIHVNMEDAIEEAGSYAENNDLVFIDESKGEVGVKLRDKGGSFYSFFNDVDVSVFPDTENEEEYIIVVNNYN